MHILYFHQHFSTPEGASGIRAYTTAKALVDAGHTVTMVCGSNLRGKTGLEMQFKRGVRRGHIEGIDVIEFELAYKNELSFARRSMLFVKFALRSIVVALREPADVVFASTTPLTTGLPGILARWLKRTPFVFEVRDLWPELPREMGMIRNPIVLALMSALEWASYRSADRLIGLSPGIVKGISRRGVSGNRITMIPNGCDLDLFQSVGRAWRPAMVRDDQLMAVYSGTHGNANGLDAVLDAAAVLKLRGYDGVCIVLIGEGSETVRLKKRVETEELKGVVFLDQIAKTTLPELLAGADLGLQTLRNVPAFYFGTSPNKFFDYIAAGLPVLNNYPGWLAGMIEKYDCGYTVPPDDPEAFANALTEACDNRRELLSKSKRARRLAESEFDRKELTKKSVAIIESALPSELHKG